MRNSALIKKSKENLKIEFWVAGIMAFIMLLLFCYEDLKTYTVWTLNLLDVIYEGRIFDFYVYSAQNLHNVTVQYVSGDFIGLIPWAIWNIPIWILQYFGGMDICTHPIMMVWSHIFLLVCVYCGYKIFIKVGTCISRDTQYISVMAKLFVFSPFVYIGVCYSGQIDIFSVLTFLISIYMLMKNEKTKFYIWAMVGFLFKPFFFLSYIAIILLKEKNLLKIVVKIFSIMSLNWIYTIIFWRAPLYQFSKKQGPSGRMLEEILGSGISAINGITISILIVLLIIIYFIAYTIHPNEDKNNQYIVYFSLLPILAYFMCVPFEHYRLLILAPLLSLVVLCKKSCLNINIVLLTIINVSGLLCNIGGSSYLLNLRYIQGSVIERILLAYKEVNYSGGIQSNLQEIIPFFDIGIQGVAAIFWVSAMAFVALNIPNKSWNNKFNGEKINYNFVWINYLMILPVLILSCYNL